MTSFVVLSRIQFFFMVLLCCVPLQAMQEIDLGRMERDEIYALLKKEHLADEVLNKSYPHQHHQNMPLIARIFCECNQSDPLRDSVLEQLLLQRNLRFDCGVQANYGEHKQCTFSLLYILLFGPIHPQWGIFRIQDLIPRMCSALQVLGLMRELRAKVSPEQGIIIETSQKGMQNGGLVKETEFRSIFFWIRHFYDFFCKHDIRERAVEVIQCLIDLDIDDTTACWHIDHYENRNAKATNSFQNLRFLECNGYKEFTEVFDACIVKKHQKSLGYKIHSKPLAKLTNIYLKFQ